MEYDRVQLKQSVKQAMKMTTPKPMVVALVFSIIISAGSGLINSVLGTLLTGGTANSFSALYQYYFEQTYDVEEAARQAVLVLLSRGPGAIFAAVVGGAVLSFLLFLWQSLMHVGYAGYCLSMVRGESPAVGKLFCAFPRAVPVLLTCVLKEVFVVLWTLLVSVVYVLIAVGVVMAALAIDSVALSVVLMLALTVLYVLGVEWVTLRYELVDYVLLDQGLTGMDAVREGKRLMQGNLGKLFTLMLSFLGWELLAVGLIFGGIAAVVGPVALYAVSYGAADIGGLIAAAGMGSFATMVMVVVAAVISLWLRPYRGGAHARFYDWARGGFSAGPNFSAGADGWGEHTDYTWSSDSTLNKPQDPKDDPWN